MKTPRQVIIFLVLVAFVGCSRSVQVGSSAGHAKPRIELRSDPDAASTYFEVAQLDDDELEELHQLDDEQRREVFQVFVAGESQDRPAVAGDVTLEADNLRFAPRYPLEPSVRYRAVFERTLGPAVTAEFDIPKRAAHELARVEHIYPSTDKLPENQLKFYLHFSAPMSRGEAYQRIHLFDSAGKEIEDPFLELGEELWDPEMRRFTLLCDPGRIKRGLKPREEVGPVLEEGKNYTLVVDAEWHDAAGTPLAETARKPFHTLPPHDAPIDIGAWKIEPRPPGTTKPLVVQFPLPLDHSLLERVLWVVGPDERRVEGVIEVTDQETCWKFTPQQPWQSGDYQLVAATTLEDLAGNSIGRAFDVDAFGPVQKNIPKETVSLPFKVAPGE